MQWLEERCVQSIDSESVERIKKMKEIHKSYEEVNIEIFNEWN